MIKLTCSNLRRVVKKFPISCRSVFIAPSFDEEDRFKVTVCGATGPVGRSLAHHLIFCKRLTLHDTEKCVCSIAVELSHIPSCCTINSFKGYAVLHEAVQGSKIVVCADGHHESHASKDEIFLTNAERVRAVCAVCAEHCPEAIVAVVTEPLNSMYPIAAASYESDSKPQRSKVIGVTALDVMRANSMVTSMKCLQQQKVNVPVVGGRSPSTLVPLLCQTDPKLSFEKDEIIALTESIRLAESEIENCSGKVGLSAASAAAQFVTSLIRAIKGADNIVECCMTETDKLPEVEYLALPCKLGPEGVKEETLPELSDFEKCLLINATGILQEDIKRGKDYLNSVKI